MARISRFSSLVASSVRLRGWIHIRSAALGQSLGQDPEVEAFTRGVVVKRQCIGEGGGLRGCEIGLAWDEAAYAADGVLDAAFLPGRMRIAEEGRDREIVPRQVTGELGAVAHWEDSSAVCCETDAAFLLNGSVLSLAVKAMPFGRKRQSV